MSAVKEGREGDVVTFLSKADRTMQDWQNNLDQSVVIAIKEKYTGIMNLLVKAGAKLNQMKNGVPLLFEAFRSGDLAILNTFLENYKGDIVNQLKCPETAVGRYMAMVKKGGTLIGAAIGTQKLDFVKRAFNLLQDNNIRLNAPLGGYPLHYAAIVAPLAVHNGNGTAEALAQDTNTTDNGCAILEYFLAQGLDVNCTHLLHGKTPLHIAAGSGNMEAVQCLINHGADVMAMDKRGCYSWMMACENQHSDIMIKLLDGVDLKQKLPHDMSFLHLSSLSGYVESSKYLLQNGVNVNCTDEDRLTPLYAAMLLDKYVAGKATVELGLSNVWFHHARNARIVTDTS